MMTVKFSFHRRYLDVVNYEKDSRASIEREKWTEKTFGKPGVSHTWFRRTYAVPTQLGINDLREVYYFKREKDATMFMLRWA